MSRFGGVLRRVAGAAAGMAALIGLTGVLASSETAVESPAAEPVQATQPPEPANPKGIAGPQDMAPANPVAAEADSPASGDASRAAELPALETLRERIKARWDALIAGDFPKAYGFETPAYREETPQDDYAYRMRRSQVRWHMATLKEIRYHSPSEAEAIITLDYSFALPGGDQIARTTGTVSEKWVYEGEQWWRQDNPMASRTPIPEGEAAGPNPTED